MHNYSPKVTLITGATGDFGKAFADRFAAAGSALILHGRSQDKLEALKGDLTKRHNVEVHTLCFDITDVEAIIQGLDSLPVELPKIDLLINNAGAAFGADSAQKSELSDWLGMVDLNIKGLVAVTHHVLGGMSERRNGHIINIGSTAGNYPYPGGHVYCASKAFVKQFSLALRADTFNQNVRVTNIEPGAVETQFSKVRYAGDEDKAAAVYANTTPLQAEDVAESVFWAACQPPHVNINRIELMATRQAPGPL
ncbi:MAG: SDR family NAD(P)-dependent oxidoreductase [Micavibrio sp.]|nr:SDR family NAD(P)-dependent oxidoreductase [Micavibrio sp.]